ncbi:lytic polysaccharide monooxygenase auxiliary activity family 9 protein [Amycolatopsis nivea]
MPRKRTMLAALGGAILAPVLMLIGPGIASAHGYVNSPPSRQAQCADGTVSCGDIKWEPQSVEGPKGLHSCSGGNDRFADLDDDSKGWKVTQVGSQVTFNWVFTARHATLDYEYFVGDTMVASFDGGGHAPGETVSHQVDLSGYSGQQKVLAVWNIADTGNAFYACIDLNVS